MITNIRDGEFHWNVIVELRGRRHTVAIEAWIPKSATMNDIAEFCDTMKDSMRRRLGAEKGDDHGKAQGKGKGKVSGADAQGQGEAESEPQEGGTKGGPDAA